MSDYQSAPYMPQVGESYRLNYGVGNRNNKLIHIRAIVDAEYIVYRYWHKGDWQYRMTDPEFFLVHREVGHMTKVKSA